MHQNHLKLASSTNLGFYHPGLATISKLIESIPHAKVLDLGAPSESSVSFFKNQNCTVQNENLHHFLTYIITKKLNMTSLSLIKALDHYLDQLQDHDTFDIILTWDIYCHLDEGATRYLSKRLAMHAKPTSKMHMVRYWGESHPISPCEFHIVNSNYALNNFDICEKKHTSTPSLQTLQSLIPEFQLQELCMNGEGMHPSLTDVVFSLTNTQKTLASQQHTKPRAAINAVAKHTCFSTILTTPPLKTPSPTSNGQHCSHAIDYVLSERLGGNSRILDLGAYNPINEATYKKYTPHILFANIPQLVNHTGWHAAPKQPSLFPLRQNWTFDVVMGWDILSHYDEQTIQYIMVLLRAHIHPLSTLHLLHHTGSDNAHRLDACNIVENTLLELKYSSDKCYGTKYSIFDIVAAMGFGTIERSFLFEPGMHEHYQEHLINLAVW